jgi:uncharacterized protein YjbI with pentapeptide repeats
MQTFTIYGVDFGGRGSSTPYLIYQGQGNIFKDIVEQAVKVGTSLAFAQLQSQYLGGLKLTGAYLPSANLTGANVDGCDFTGAVLSGSTCVGISAQSAVFLNARLDSVDFTNAILDRSDFRQANTTSIVPTNASIQDILVDAASATNLGL